jgi:hypothetical protein
MIVKYITLGIHKGKLPSGALTGKGDWILFKCFHEDSQPAGCVCHPHSRSRFNPSRTATLSLTKQALRNEKEPKRLSRREVRILTQTAQKLRTSPQVQSPVRDTVLQQSPVW